MTVSLVTCEYISEVPLPTPSVCIGLQLKGVSVFGKVQKAWIVSQPVSPDSRRMLEVQRLDKRPAANQTCWVERAELLRIIKAMKALLLYWSGWWQRRWEKKCNKSRWKPQTERTCSVRFSRTPSPNRHAHHTALECPPNFPGTWIVGKPFKREIGTVLKWCWQLVDRSLSVTLCFSCSMWAIICNLSYPHEFTAEDV